MIKTISASEFCHRVFDGTHATPKPVSEGRPLVTSKNIVGGRLDLGDVYNISQSDYEDIQRRSYVSQWDVLFSMIGSVGEVYLERNPHIEYAIKNVGVFSCLDEQRAKWLYYFLKSPIAKRIIKNQMSGAVQKFLGLGTLRSFPIPEIVSDRLPGIELLHNLDAKIELNNRINAELEGMAKLLYDYWFVQFDFPMSAAQAAALGKPHLTGHPYRASGGKMIHNETLKRDIPEGWIDGTAENLFIFNPSVSLRDGTVAGFFDMDAVPTRGFMTKAVQRKAFSGGTKFSNGDVVVARITPCLENGKTALITQLENGEIGFGSTEFIVMRGRSRSLSAFGACLARSEHFRKFAILNMTGTSGRKRIEASVLKTFSLSIPPIELLSDFEDICKPMFQKMTANEKQNQELTQLRDWLLPMLMNGQVTVGPNEH